MSKVVVDTNVLVALLDRKDVHHQRAVDLIGRIEKGKNLFIMDCILVELYSVIARRGRERGYDFAALFPQIRGIEEALQLISAYEYRLKLHDHVLKLMINTNGRMNYHDALISLVMRTKRIRTIATFDNDFNDIGWLVVES